MSKFLVLGLPEREELLQLSNEDLAGFVLEYLNKEWAQRPGKAFCFYNYTYSFIDDLEVAIAISEAWSWLINESILVLQPGQQPGFYVLSRRGREIRTTADLETFRKSNILPRARLHPMILKVVSADFAKGEYDSAVFRAFKEVEVAVRFAANYDESLYGVPLMSKAFDPASGPLTDTSVISAEREALRNLFSGAIGSYKNPHSHRKVKLDPEDSVEMIVLASHLLKIVDSRAKNITTD